MRGRRRGRPARPRARGVPVSMPRRAVNQFARSKTRGFRATSMPCTSTSPPPARDLPPGRGMHPARRGFGKP